MRIKRTRFLLLLVAAFAIGTVSTYLITTVTKYGWYEVKNTLGIQNEVIFLEDNFFGAPEGTIPVFEGSEVFPTNNAEIINAEDIPRKVTPVTSRGKVIVANLDQSKLFLYDDGDTVEEFTIHATGVQNSLWDTPPGEYSVQYKNEEYFSPVADTWMPYTVQFFNDYYIHGWPKHPNGDLVDNDFVAGAIRLSTRDAKKVYDFAQIGADVVVISSVPTRFTDTEITGGYAVTDDYDYLPRTDALSYLVADIDTGQIILEKRPDRISSIASITKLMTALVSLETYDQLQETEVSYRAVATRGDQGRLRAGQVWQIGDLMYPLILESSNDAAEVLAEHVDRDGFMELMNGYAKSIGMTSTTFNDPSGLSAGNASTAEDLLRLARHIYTYKSYIFSTAQIKRHTIDRTTWYNNNPYKNDEEFLGGKNGLTTAAGHTLLTVLELELADGTTKNIVFVVLKSNDEDRDTRILQSYVERYVEFQPFEN